jgi:hypothetical protein
MTLSIRQLLIHSTDLPAYVRRAIEAALEAPVLHRGDAMESSAALLSIVTGLEIDDARELLDLSPRPAFEGVSTSTGAGLSIPDVRSLPEGTSAHDFA